MPDKAIASMGGLPTVLNSMRMGASANFQDVVPILNENNFREYATGVLNNHDIYNEWAVNLINKVGLTVIRARSWENPLAFLKKGMLEYGDTVEEIFTDILKEKTYKSTMGQETAGEVFASAVPDIYAVFHKENRFGLFEESINHQRLQRAFTSLRSLEDFISSLISNLIKSDNFAEFTYTKMLLENYAQKGLFKTVKVAEPTDRASVDLLLEQVKSAATKFTFLSRDYNAFNVTNHTPREEQVVIISAEMDAKIDVQSLASAFNLDKIEFLPRKIVLDKMPIEGAHLIVMSKELLVIHDTLFEIRDIYNPMTLEIKFFLHHHSILSTSRFENALVFTSADLPAPASVSYTLPESLKAGSTTPAVIEVKDSEEEVLDNVALLYEIIGAKSANTKVSNTGALQIGSDEPVGTFDVKVTALYHDEVTVTTTVTVA